VTWAWCGGSWRGVAGIAGSAVAGDAGRVAIAALGFACAAGGDCADSSVEKARLTAAVSRIEMMLGMC